MTKNQKTYLLLAAVVIVWGAIGYQVYSHYTPDVPDLPTNISQKFVPDKTQKVENYTIQPDYRDPFLGKIYKKPKPKVKKVVRKPKPQVVFPNISYNGIIKGANENAFIISINGSQEIFQKGKVMKGVELVKGDGNEITVKFKGITKKYPIIQ